MTNVTSVNGKAPDASGNLILGATDIAPAPSVMEKRQGTSNGQARSFAVDDINETAFRVVARQSFVATAPPIYSLPSPRIAKSIPRDQPLSPFWFIDPMYEWGIRNRTDPHDCTVELNIALGSGEDINLGDGLFSITDKLSMTRYGQKLCGTGRFNSSSLYVTHGLAGRPDFNLGASAIVQAFGESEIRDIEIFCYQPINGTGTGTNGTVRQSDLSQYPWAIDIADADRSRVFDVRLSGAWNGIHGNAGTTKAGGAWRLRGLELGCLNIPFYFDSPGHDFNYFDEIEVWPFGMDSQVSALYQANRPQSYLLNQDGGSYGRIAFWKGDLNLNNQSNLATQIAYLGLDNGARVNFDGGYWTVGDIIANTDNQSASVVNVSTGTVDIGSCWIATNVPSDVPLVSVTGGRCSISRPTFREYSFQGQGIAPGPRVHAAVTGGDLKLNMPSHIGVGNTTRGARPMINQNGGRLMVIGGTPQDIGSGSGIYVRTQTDDWHQVVHNSFLGWTLSRKGGSFGTYVDNTAVGSTIVT